MRYRIDRENYHRFDILERNKLPARSYFIPFSSKEKADMAQIDTRRYCSDKVRCLSGEWDFAFFAQPAQLPQILDTDTVSFDKLDVPSCWQFRGYCKPFYLNFRYQFPFNPPTIPQEDPVGKTLVPYSMEQGIRPKWVTPVSEYNYVGVYRKHIAIEDLNKTRILSFLGVASCVDLYVNGEFAGYSEGSHNVAEFCISRFLREGDNELLAVVRRWCTGSYLECQDMFRNNGIFRDVLLHELENTDLWDVDFLAEKQDTGYCTEIRLEFLADTQVQVTLSGHGLYRSQNLHTSQKKAKICFQDLPVQQWTAETPVLYDLYIESPSGCVKIRVGFKHIEIQKDLFLLNGCKVKFKGVNHHDTDSRNGYCMSAMDIKRDVLLCKEFNIDTIRTSHYPPDPMLLEWCDELGVYVVDEADLETHGAFPPGKLTHDPAWQSRYLDRVSRLYGRDKTHPSVVMWSLGNEAGGYANTDAMYQWLKARTRIPVHYEHVVHTVRTAYDIASEMYPTVDKVRQTGEKRRGKKKLNDRPYFLCEYAHAMGVGPGGAEDYWQQIYRFDSLIGGCVWEMVDHAVLETNGEYTYGGDHGEWIHDSNFCVDGLFYPDRTPSTGAKLMKFIYRPVRIRHVEDCRYEIFNTTAFTDASSFIMAFQMPDGNSRSVCVSVPPMSKRIVEVRDCSPKHPWVNIVVTDKQNGREVSLEQIVFDLPVIQNVKPAGKLPEWIDVCNGDVVLTKDGKKMIANNTGTILFRAPTDNDYRMDRTSAMDDYLTQKIQVKRVQVREDRLTIESVVECRKQSFFCTDTYESYEDGILLTSRLRSRTGGGWLPRFGKVFHLEKSFDQVEYIGRAGESYCDMKDHEPVAHVCCRVVDMTEPNIRPQESGNRCDTVFVKVSDRETDFSFTAVGKPFELGIKPYTDLELTRMRHRSDEVPTGTYVAISAFQMGIGTGSCGPATQKKYCYRAKDAYVFRCVIR